MQRSHVPLYLMQHSYVSLLLTWRSYVSLYAFSYLSYVLTSIVVPRHLMWRSCVSLYAFLYRSYVSLHVFLYHVSSSYVALIRVLTCILISRTSIWRRTRALATPTTTTPPARPRGRFTSLPPPLPPPSLPLSLPLFLSFPLFPSPPRSLARSLSHTPFSHASL